MEPKKSNSSGGTSTNLEDISSEGISKTLLERLKDLVDRYISADISSEEISKTLLERLKDLVDRHISAESSLLKKLNTPAYLASDIAIEHQLDIATGISRLWGIVIKLSRILAHGEQNNEQQLNELLKKLYLIPPPPLG